jgi:hypothetical protein
MVYFLGRDLTVAITSEHPDYGVIAHTGTGTPTSEVTSLRTASVRDFTQTGSEAGIVDLDGADAVFAGARTGHVDNGLGTVFGSIDQSDSAGLGFTISCEVVNLTGADLSLGAMDEDLSFIGQRATMRVEVRFKTSQLIVKPSPALSDWSILPNTVPNPLSTCPVRAPAKTASAPSKSTMPASLPVCVKSLTEAVLNEVTSDVGVPVPV